MRERARRRVLAEAQSHRATPEELRDASKRLKELEQEMLELPLTEEAKQGEPRERRYARLLRLRAMREDFVGDRPIVGDHPNGMVLSLVMTIASFMICAFCAGSLILGIQFLNQKPNPADTAAAFWNAVEAQNYSQIYSTYLSSTQRVASPSEDFVTVAAQADSDYGVVTAFLQIGSPKDSGQQATVEYQVTRGQNHKVSYTCTLSLVLRGGSWYIDDTNSAFAPSLVGVPTPTPHPSPTATATATSIATTTGG